MAPTFPTALLLLLLAPPTRAADPNAQVKVYKTVGGCAAGSAPDLSFKISHVESNCKYCWDSCSEFWETGTRGDAHGGVRSINIPDGYIALTYNTCSGSFGYADPGFQKVLSSGCHEVNNNGDVYQLAHFVFAKESDFAPGTYVLAGETAKKPGEFSGQLTTGHWSFGPGGSSNADGTSWYT